MVRELGLPAAQTPSHVYTSPKEKNTCIIMISPSNQAPLKPFSTFRVVSMHHFSPKPSKHRLTQSTNITNSFVIMDSTPSFTSTFLPPHPAQIFPQCLQAAPALFSLILTFHHPPLLGLHIPHGAHSPFTIRWIPHCFGLSLPWSSQSESLLGCYPSTEPQAPSLEMPQSFVQPEDLVDS